MDKLVRGGTRVLHNRLSNRIRIWRSDFSLPCPRPRGPKGDDLPVHVFVGFGAGPEESLFTRYASGHGASVARLNQIDVTTFGAWQRLGFAAAMRTL